MFIKKVISRGRVQSLLIPILFLALIISASSVEASEQQAINKKRELRAVWISTVFNIDWPVKGASADEQKKQFINILDDVKSMGMNAVVVQVRPTGDAFYPSKYSPWSEYLTGTQGKDPGYDPLAFMVEEAHKRNLEFHAWLNPYRITTSHQDVNKLAVNHPAKQHPDWVVKHGKQLLYNPGIPAVRDYIKNSTLEIVQNYDVDAIHMDDYFYPYADAENFKDETTYETYGKGENKDDWRRENVNTLVRDLSTSIKQTKSHVKFGISPFGIWRNKHNDTQGSETNGLSAYDNIYADSRLWVHKEWVDYLTPQVYWSIGYNAANYDVITKWWNNEAQGKNIHLYIGQAAYKINNDSDKAWENPAETNNQLALNSTLQNVKGSMFFSYRNLKTNILGIKDQLRANAYKYPALIPTMPWLDNSAPSKPSIHSVTDGSNGATISWNNNAGNDAAYFVIYRFNRGQLIDGNNSSVIVTTIRNNGSKVLSYVDKAVTNSSDYTYAVSAVDRLHNESDLVPASTPEPEPKTQFKDVSTNHGALTYINFLAEKKIISGFPDGTFKPEDRLTRLQAIFMILNEKGIKDVSNVSNPNFIDVNPSTYGYKEIAKAVELGIVTGKVNDSGQKYFDPNGVLTRAEMATILTRNYNLNGTHSEEFSDVPKDYWAHPYIQSLAKNGIAVGYGNGMFGPGDPLKREQFAIMMARTINEELR